MNTSLEWRYHRPEDNPLLLRTSDFIPIPDNQQTIDKLSPEFEKFMLIFNCITSITGIIGNMLTILAVGLCKKLQTVNNFFVAHLALVDLLICGVVVPVNINGILNGDGHLDQCMIFGPIIVAVMALSLLSLANIALNRYFLVCKQPHVYAMVYKKRNIAIICVLSYIYTFLMILPPFVGFGNWAENVKFKACLFTAYDLNSYKYGVGVLSSVAFAPPAAVCLFAYYSIIKKFRESRAKFSRVAPQANASTTDSEDTTAVGVETATRSSRTYEQPTTSQSQNAIVNLKQSGDSSRNKDAKTFKTILGMILVFAVFMLCWLPMVVVFVIDFYGTWSAHIYVMLLSISWLNSSINIFLYAALNMKFRKAFQQLLTFKWRELRV